MSISQRGDLWLSPSDDELQLKSSIERLIDNEYGCERHRVTLSKAVSTLIFGGGFPTWAAWVPAFPNPWEATVNPPPRL